MGACVRNGRIVGQTEPLAQAFIAREEEQFIFLDWSAHNTAKLIALESWNFLVRRIEVVLGVECAVAQEFKAGTMKCVRSRIGDHVHHTARNQSVFGAVVVGRDGEFPDCIDSQIRSCDAARCLA